jgi:undecaprenyl pyrophosphate phosphatase UppP
MIKPKRVFEVSFWIGFVVALLPSCILAFQSERPISTLFVGIVSSLVWGLIIGGISVLGQKIIRKIRSKNEPPDNP